jgi:hypothetical protein
MKLGKLAPKIDNRTLQLANYLDTAKLPTIPTQEDWSGKVPSWPLYGNDVLGDCTAAGVGHMLMCWSANANTEVVPTDHDVVTLYSAVSGYDPSTGENDNGAVEIDVLNYWRKTGIASHKIYAYASLGTRNHNLIKAAVYLFGGIYIGIALPLSAQNQDVWDISANGFRGDGRPGSWGGHAINLVGFTQDYLIGVTWGALKKMTWAFADHYMDEAYAVLSQDFIDSKGIAPNAVNWSALQADLKIVVH